MDRLLDVRAVALLLGISCRGVWRFRDMGKLPAPVQLGRLIRWRSADISSWIADGAPDCRATNWKARRHD
ncbi:MAG: helix-turn-helix domain-containing protein [Candidatus Hydrogenedens sp.]|nr:helix-turn-helix domain-containing protein [Candidatus Hydrogenedens sp.]